MTGVAESPRCPRDPTGCTAGGLPLAVDSVDSDCPDCGRRRVHRFSDDLGAHYQCADCAWELFMAWVDLEQPSGARSATECVNSSRTGGRMALPTTKQSRASQEVTPLDARVLLAGMPKAGKTTLLAGWAPETTLIIDTHRGTTLLDGEHYVAHVSDWRSFETTVTELTTNPHQFKTVGIDLVDDIWKFADQHAAAKKNVAAAGLIDYGKGIAEAEGLFRQQIGKLLATDLGLWFLGHTDTVEEDKVTRYVPRLDKRVRTYIQGVCQFVLLAETLGVKRVVHTAPSAKFEAGSRVPLPEPMDLDARALYAAMAKGLKAGQPQQPAPTNSSSRHPEEIAA